MRFDKFIPSDQLKHYIKYFVVSENAVETEYKIFPSTGLVIGFQYRGQLSTIKNDTEDKLASAGIMGISDSYKTFRNSANTGTILVYFTEIGFTQFASHPAHALFNLSVSLEDILDAYSVGEMEEKLTLAPTDKQRIHIVQRFLLSQLKDIETDKLIVEAVKKRSSRPYRLAKCLQFLSGIQNRIWQISYAIYAVPEEG